MLHQSSQLAGNNDPHDLGLMKGNGEVSWTLGVSRYRSLLLGGTHPLQEWDERHESVIVGRVAELLHQGLGLVLGQLLTEVVEASLVLAVLGGLEDGEDLVLGQHLLSLLGGASNLSDCLEGGVEVAGSDEAH